MSTSRVEMLMNWRTWIDRTVEAVTRVLPGAEVYLIGSVAEGRHTAASDLDLLVIVDNPPTRVLEKARLIAKIEELAGLPYYHPVQFHIVDRSTAKLYMKRSKAIRLA